MDSSQDRDLCSYERDGSSWECWLPSVDGDRCMFHDEMVDADADALLAAIEDSNQSSKGEQAGIEFYDADFPKLDLSYRRIDGPELRPLEFQGTTFSGLRAFGARFDHPLDLSDATVDGDLCLAGATILGDANISADRIEGNLDLTELQVEGDLLIDGVDLMGELTLKDAHVGGDLLIRGSSLCRDHTVEKCSLAGATIEGEVQIGGSDPCTRVPAMVDASNLVVGSSLQIGPADIRRELKLEGVSAASIEVKNLEAQLLDLEGGQTSGDLCITGGDPGGIDLNEMGIGGSAEITELTAKLVDAAQIEIAQEMQIDGLELSSGRRVAMPRAVCNGKVELHDISETDSDDSGTLSLRRAVFLGDLQLSDVELSGFDLTGITCERDLKIMSCLAEEKFTAGDALFEGDVEIKKGRLAGESNDLSETSEGRPDLNHITAQNQVRIIDVSLPSGLAAENSKVEYLNLSRPASDGEDGVAVSLAESIISGGVARERSNCPLTIDCREATLGDINLYASGDQRQIEMLSLDRTEFDGFDFSQYKSDLRQREWHLPPDDITYRSLLPERSRLLEIMILPFRPVIETFDTFVAGWRLRRLLSGDVPVDEDAAEVRDALRPPTQSVGGADGTVIDDPATVVDYLEGLEITYLKAKHGARESGDDRIAGKFLQREVLIRQIIAAGAVLAPVGAINRSRVKAFFTFFETSMLQLTSGYGERPHRVVWSMFFVIGLFALAILPALSLLTGYKGPETSWLVVSFGAFVTLLTSAPIGNDKELIQFFLQLEGLIGGLLMALFVFSLTRAVNR